MNIPNFIDCKVVDEKGYFTAEYKIILQQLFTELQANASNEGLVAPTQTAANIALIQSTFAVLSPTNSTPIYNCQYGTILYNETANSIQIAINNGSNAPIFKTVTLT
jgi:hypothetical protein